MNRVDLVVRFQGRMKSTLRWQSFTTWRWTSRHDDADVIVASTLQVETGSAFGSALRRPCQQLVKSSGFGSGSTSPPKTIPGTDNRHETVLTSGALACPLRTLNLQDLGLSGP